MQEQFPQERFRRTGIGFLWRRTDIGQPVSPLADFIPGNLGDAHPVPADAFHQPFIHPGFNKIIAVHEPDIPPFGITDSKVSRRGRTAVRFMEDPYPVIRFRQPVHQLFRPVVGTVVHQQYFQIPVSLAADGIHAPRKAVHNIINRYDNANQLLLFHTNTPADSPHTKIRFPQYGGGPPPFRCCATVLYMP